MSSIYMPMMASSHISRMASSHLAEDIIEKIHSARCVAVEITNHSRLTLRFSGYHCQNGYLYSPPTPSIAPGTQMCAVFTKTNFSLRGSCGVLTYSLQDGSPDRLAILFSNPFNYTHYQHTFALHFTQSRSGERKLYEVMLNSPSTLEHCKKAEGIAIRRSHSLCHNGVQVSATMSRGGKSILRILVEDDHRFM